MSFAYAMFTIGSMLLYSAFTNLTIADIVLGRPAPSELPSLAPDLSEGEDNGGLKSGGRGDASAVLREITRGFPGSGKRDECFTASGGISDHWTGCRECDAKDIPAVGTVGDRIANTVAKRAGAKSATPGRWQNINYKGVRVQIGWKTPDHGGHVHVGTRKIGYNPPPC